MPKAAVIAQIEPLALNAKDAAAVLGVSVWRLLELREDHPLYHPDMSKPKTEKSRVRAAERPRVARKPGSRGRPEADPLWSLERLKFIAFAWQKTPEGVRRFSDDEAYAIWNDMMESKANAFLVAAGHILKG